MPNPSFEDRLKRIETHNEARTYQEGNRKTEKNAAPQYRRDDEDIEGHGIFVAATVAGGLGVGAVYTFDPEMAKPVAIIVLPILVILTLVLVFRSMRRGGTNISSIADVFYDLSDVVKGLLKHIT